MQNLNPSIRPFKHQVRMPIAIDIMQQHALAPARSRISPRRRQQSIRRAQKNIRRPTQHRLNHQVRMPIAIQSAATIGPVPLCSFVPTIRIIVPLLSVVNVISEGFATSSTSRSRYPVSCNCAPIT